MGFADELRRFAATTERNAMAVHQEVVVAVKSSWVNGSAETGAPVLPIASGDGPTIGRLRRGVRVAYPDPNTALVYTTVPYAGEVEENLRGVHFHSGGPHGFKLTVAGFPRLLDSATKRILGGGA